MLPSSLLHPLRNARRTTVFLITILGCAACATAPQQLPQVAGGAPVTFDDYADFGPRPAMPSRDDIFYLSPEQRSDFLSYYNASEHSGVDKHRRITNYLHRFGEAFNYQGDTFTAEQTMAAQGGNCMSMAVLTTALANVVDVEVGYQLVDSIPVYELEDNLAFKGQHVRSYLFDPDYQPTDSSLMVIRRPGIIVDYFPSGREHFIGNITEDAYVAMFYRNRAANALAEEDFNSAYWYLRESMVYAPEHADAINTLAVLHRRVGDAQRAEALYEYGLEIEVETVSLVKNYRNMLRLQGREDEASALEDQLHTLDDPSPFNWLSLAREAHDAENFALAVRMYDKTLDVAPYLQDAHLGKVQAQLDMGQIAEAATSLDTATEYMYREDERSMYIAKLSTLRGKLVD